MKSTLRSLNPGSHSCSIIDLLTFLWHSLVRLPTSHLACNGVQQGTPCHCLITLAAHPFHRLPGSSPLQNLSLITKCYPYYDSHCFHTIFIRCKIFVYNIAYSHFCVYILYKWHYTYNLHLCKFCGGHLLLCTNMLGIVWRQQTGTHQCTLILCYTWLVSASFLSSTGNYGYASYKYMPYGPVEEVIPYLIRRAHENKAMLEGADEERKLVREELKRRFLKFKWIYTIIFNVFMHTT